MIDHVANQLAEKLKALPFVSLAGGIARAQKIKDGDGVRTLPAAQKPDGSSTYAWLTPSSKQVGISYFENLGNDLDANVSGGRGQMYRSTLRVVVWLNLSRITPPDVGSIMAQTVAAISAAQITSDFVNSVRITPIREVPRSAEIFSKYSYNEAEWQYLMLPYDYFAFDFDVRYVLNAGCHLTKFIKKDPSC